jgi:hypothetical protein
MQTATDPQFPNKLAWFPPSRCPTNLEGTLYKKKKKAGRAAV